ncbi:hypothetical protein [Amycolatopsis methanolica]|nr:hypothetical protein [Amycolatopsis methanolica]
MPFERSALTFTGPVGCRRSGYRKAKSSRDGLSGSTASDRRRSVRPCSRAAEGSCHAGRSDRCQMIEIAATGVPLSEPAQTLLETPQRRLPAEVSWLALSTPGTNAYATVGSTGLQRSVLDRLDRPSVSREIRLAELDRNRPPVSLAELPVPADELPTWTECLIPAGFRDGLGVPLFEPGGPYLGLLALLFSGRNAPSDDLRDRVGQLAPLVARCVSPMRSLLGTARLVQSVTSGAVLYRDGATHPLPGLEDHSLLADAWEHHARSMLTLRPDNPITQTGVLSEFSRRGVSSRLGKNRADVKHQMLDPIIVAGPWGLVGGLVAVTVRKLLRRAGN